MDSSPSGPTNTAALKPSWSTGHGTSLDFCPNFYPSIAARERKPRGPSTRQRGEAACTPAVRLGAGLRSRDTRSAGAQHRGRLPGAPRPRRCAGEGGVAAARHPRKHCSRTAGLGAHRGVSRRRHGDRRFARPGIGKGSARRVDVDAGRVTCIVSGGRRERGGRRAGRRPANRGRRRRLRPVHGGDGVCVQAGLPAWSTTLWKKRSRDPVAEDFVGRLAGHRGASGRRRRHHSCNRARPGRS